MENCKVSPYTGNNFVVASERTHLWSGIEQNIFGRIELETMYNVVAFVRINGSEPKADVRATLCIQEADNRDRYVTMGRYQRPSLHLLFPPFPRLYSVVLFCNCSDVGWDWETCLSNHVFSYSVPITEGKVFK
jgi:hypothetical protein